MVSRIDLRMEINEWLKDYNQYSKKTPLNNRAERLLKKIKRLIL